MTLDLVQELENDADVNRALIKLEIKLNTIIKWMYNNGLTISKKKTKYIIFSKKGNLHQSMIYI